MALLEKALDYIVGVVTENEEVKKFPEDFVTASMKWIRSWFLEDDPKTEAKINDPQRSEVSKRTILEGKLEDLQDNPTFMKELEEKLAAFSTLKEKHKNVVQNSNIEAQGNVHIGDTNISNDSHNQKNIIKGSTIKAGGDFRLGDDVVSSNQQVHIVHNCYGANKANEKSNTPQTLASELKGLLAKEKTEKVIDCLLDRSETNDKDTHNTVLMLSARFSRINTQEQKGIISNSEAGIERNKINHSLAEIIDKIL